MPLNPHQMGDRDRWTSIWGSASLEWVSSKTTKAAQRNPVLKGKTKQNNPKSYLDIFALLLCQVFNIELNNSNLVHMGDKFYVAKNNARNCYFSFLVSLS